MEYGIDTIGTGGADDFSEYSSPDDDEDDGDSQHYYGPDADEDTEFSPSRGFLSAAAGLGSNNLAASPQW